jgi:hypothetical protein
MRRAKNGQLRSLEGHNGESSQVTRGTVREGEQTSPGLQCYFLKEERKQPAVLSATVCFSHRLNLRNGENDSPSQGPSGRKVFLGEGLLPFRGEWIRDFHNLSSDSVACRFRQSFVRNAQPEWQRVRS